MDLRRKILNKIEQGWLCPNGISYLLYPVTLLYRMVFQVRTWSYRIKLLKSERLPVPVIVIGNLSVGGTGKTPLVVMLVDYFKSIDYKPGVISRGYKSNSSHVPRLVEHAGCAAEVGDEPVMIYERCHVPVAVGPDKVASGRLLIKDCDCDLIISDDGFQHFALERDLDIVVIDGERGLGNGWCLPAGPLREPAGAIERADVVVVNGNRMTVQHPNHYPMHLSMQPLVRIHDKKTCTIKQFEGQTVNAIAGIGNPQRFFDQLGAQGLEVIQHAFDDHHRFQQSDLVFDNEFPVLMTEKDAVKCRSLIHSTAFWSVPVEAEIAPGFFQLIEQRLG